jgi:hypothetical protein
VNLPKGVTDPESGRTPRGLPGWHRLELVMCAGCGMLLPRVDPTETMLRTLSRLARFGLAGETKPILGS